MRRTVLVLLTATACQGSLDDDARDASDARSAYIECPDSTQWDGEVCLWRYVVTDVRCPSSSVWDGSRCVSTQVSCPEGAAWDGARCVPIGQPVADDGLPIDRGPIVEPASDASPASPTAQPSTPAVVDAFHYR